MIRLLFTYGFAIGAAIATAAFATADCAGPATLMATPGAPLGTATSTQRTDNPSALKWDSVEKVHEVKAGETSVKFVFTVTNHFPSNVYILALHTSCACTVASLPPLPKKPFTLLPGSSAEIDVTLELNPKLEILEKTIVVESTLGYSTLRVKAQAPIRKTAPPDNRRDPTRHKI